ncbi:MAG: site-specific integrase, partial [Acidobacteria bacterium]|nr:site-specific integrase [Acidobacteriota bacterium]
KRQTQRKKGIRRIVPVPLQLITETAMYLARHPEMKGRIFKLSRAHFFKVFQDLSLKSGLDPELAHPHILRHTRAIELLRGGAPVSIVQDLLGHSGLNTTAIYLGAAHEKDEFVR